MSEENRSATPERDGDTEQKILAAAHAVFLRGGAHGARMQEIADEAGVNKALLHYYFRSKERLAEAVFRRAAGQLFPRLFGILASPLALEAKVEAFVDAEMEFLAAHPYLPGYVLSEANFNPELIRRVLTGGPRPPLDALQAQLDAEAAAGRIRPIGAEQFLVNLISLIVFPFVARPMVQILFPMDDAGFRAFVDERRASLASFILNALRP